MRGNVRSYGANEDTLKKVTTLNEWIEMSQEDRDFKLESARNIAKVGK